ncbi:lytic polysaccharide monooxygenase [Kutzneria sp. CA-103260]|uniref:lytic polysaccharide monooxygenase n=1 Tax=Kutzneria sp. CA-103260 TaxID=2802641 RepID=UPI001BF0ED0F|nr:lytic polysaccharide monooxygenase [Kutzneria sp. CA-103260]QUQ64202.1 chitin-binding protein [Kutzneria sp. CA-103260]
MRRPTLWLVAVLAAVTALVLGGTPAWAHGAMTFAGSRTFLCYEDGITATGQIVPHNPACQAAIAHSGPTPLYNWFAVGNRTANGGTVGVIPDGKLCSGNSDYYDFAGFDLARDDWPVTHLTSGATIQVKYNKWAAHPGTFRLYITKDGWDRTRPLTWNDLESMPFSTAVQPPSVGSPGSLSSYYYWNATLPAAKTGPHVIYSIWARSDSTETFYGCSDVLFDGGNGQVTGIGGGQTPPPSTPCTATYAITGSWAGGFQGQVTVTNSTSAPIGSWDASWTLPDGENVSSVWNGALSRSGSLATVANASWNGQLAPGASTTFGFTADYPGTPAVPSQVSCSAA